MIKIISHRGNLNGQNAEQENKPSYIDIAISLGYDVEVDIRLIDEKLFLGHDIPLYCVNDIWVIKRKDNILFHCKNIDAVYKLKTLDSAMKYFCHATDDFTLTSIGHIWVHNLKLLVNKNCIIPLLSKIEIDNYNIINAHSICTDEVLYLQKLISGKSIDN